MKVPLGKLAALTGLCTLFGTVGLGAFAQGDHMGGGRMSGDHRMDGGGRMGGDHRMDGGGRMDRNSIRRMRQELEVLHRVYDHEIKSGHPERAMKAHLKAEAIRARLHEKRHMRGF